MVEIGEKGSDVPAAEIFLEVVARVHVVDYQLEYFAYKEISMRENLLLSLYIMMNIFL